MIKTEAQRRWWFATHPEFSHRDDEKTGEEEDENEGEPSPESVDVWADEALKYATGTTAELIKSAKFWFGAEFESKTPEEKHALLWGDDESASNDDERGGESRGWSSEQSTGHPAADRDTYDKYEDVLDRTDLEALLWNEQIRQQDSIGLEPDPISYLDIAPYLRFITSPIGALKGLFRSTARDAILGIREKDGTREPPRLPPRGTPERAEIEAARRRGRDAKIREERADIQKGGKGSGVWSEEELGEIRRTGNFPPDTQWHHDPTVANRPDLAADPRVVHPLRGGREGHLRDGHNWDWRNPKE